MKFSSLLTDRAVLEELGQRMTSTRRQQNLTQAALAKEAGVSKTTVERIENGLSVRTDNFIRLLRTMHLLERLEVLVPEPLPDPLEQLRVTRRRRQRVREPRIEQQPTAPWNWGDEQ